MKIKFKNLAITLIILNIFLTPLFSNNSESEEEEKYLKIFREVYLKLKNEYIEKKKPSELLKGAIKGMINTLNDPHTAFLESTQKEELEIETRGEYGGLGIVVGVKDHYLVIISPIEDTPAERAGLKPGDIIYKIEGELVKDPKLDEIVKKLRGEPGTKVTITIKREGFDDLIDYTLTREIIKIKSVKYETIDTNIGYIKITSFSKNAPKELSDALNYLLKNNIKGLIIDLRNNPGGLLDVAVRITDYFISNGLIVYTRTRTNTFNPFLNQNYYAHKELTILPENIPLVVLINKGSASASEIFAGAIQDHKRGLIIGTTSFGKGSVQSVVELDENSALRYTTALYYTPNGRQIHKKGIEPDIEVEDLKLSKNDMKMVNKIQKEKYIENFLKENPQYTDADIDSFLKKLNENDIELDRIILKRLIKEQESREKSKPLIDMEIDPQLKMAYQIIKLKIKK